MATNFEESKLSMTNQTIVGRFRKRMNERYVMPRWEYEAKCAFWLFVGILIGIGLGISDILVRP